jgi:hypothetical protein
VTLQGFLNKSQNGDLKENEKKKLIFIDASLTRVYHGRAFE